ncbi:YisL family protein [Shouchella shacheensis]|uniref:YisL family protein n=1 Tax=Shouchella shacheensis TaxID=1649580 RepID=UPI00073FC44F|nr:YisL family protein [Shouchella shacheensis]
MSPRVLEIFQASHEGSWAFLAILFVVSYFLYRANKNRAGTIIQMILRLFYLIMIVTGAGMLYGYGFPTMFVVKGILALVLIGFMEMTLAKTKRGESALVGWILVVVTLLLVVLMGYQVISF